MISIPPLTIHTTTTLMLQKVHKEIVKLIHMNKHIGYGKQKLKHEPMRFILMFSTFELQQEPIRLILVRQSCSVELLFMFNDQYLYVN